MAILFIRTVILYFLTLFAIKLMGKRELGQLQPFELVVLLIISEMASLCMQSNTMPMVYSVVPILTITLLQITLALANLKWVGLRRLLCGRPAVLIEKGRLCQAELARQRININDLQEMARAQGYFDLSAIDYAIMETNGSLSVLPQVAKRPLEVGDFTDALPQEQLPLLLILDGQINSPALRMCGKDERWLRKQLATERADCVADVFVAGLDSQGQFFAQLRRPS